MDNGKIPFLPEEALRTQRVEIYLNDLKERLKELRQQHDVVIQNSVDIIKEIDKVSSSFLLTHPTCGGDDDENDEYNNSDNNTTKIRKLILEFEKVKTNSPSKLPPVMIESQVDIQKILQNFEKLNESHMLKESLVLFERAKASFEKIDTFFAKMDKPELKTDTKKSCSFQSKLKQFNMRNEEIKETESQYTSCCSSAMSIDNYHSTEDRGHFIINNMSSNNSLENGYEGDNDDSEYDLLAIKKKKSKCLPNNM